MRQNMTAHEILIQIGKGIHRQAGILFYLHKSDIQNCYIVFCSEEELSYGKN